MPSPLTKFVPRSFLRVVAPIWVAILIAGSLLPGKAKQAIGTSRLPPPALHQQPVLITRTVGDWKHRAFHVLGFGATTLLFVSLVSTLQEELGVSLGVFGLGVFIEFAQTWVFNNPLETEDIRDDAYGIAAIYLLLLFWKQIDKNRGRELMSI